MTASEFIAATDEDRAAWCYDTETTWADIDTLKAELDPHSRILLQDAQRAAHDRVGREARAAGDAAAYAYTRTWKTAKVGE